MPARSARHHAPRPPERRAPTRLARHRHLEDRFTATLRPRRELLEAIWNAAIYQTDKRRRKAGAEKQPILRVRIWCQLSQVQVIAAYVRHQKYLDEPHPITSRTLTRQVAGLRHLELVNVIHPVSKDGRGGFRREPNVYVITHAGKLWIKRHARAVQIPQVV